MGEVEARFLHNTKKAIAESCNEVDLFVHKGPSHFELSGLVAKGMEGYFDLIYIDGSHQAPEVLCDAVLCFLLLRKSGIIVFDDYLWHEQLPYGVDPIRSPKMAIDAFTNIFCRKTRIAHRAPLYQLYVEKIDD